MTNTKAHTIQSLLLCAACLLAALPALADEVEVTQKNKEFAPGRVTIAPGDTVVFLNDDPITHNMFSRTEGHKFNLKMQKPGVVLKQTFDEPGEAIVRCAIHPKMKLIVNVVGDGPPAKPDEAE